MIIYIDKKKSLDPDDFFEGNNVANFGIQCSIPKKKSTSRILSICSVELEISYIFRIQEVGDLLLAFGY